MAWTDRMNQTLQDTAEKYSSSRFQRESSNRHEIAADHCVVRPESETCIEQHGKEKKIKPEQMKEME